MVNSQSSLISSAVNSFITTSAVIGNLWFNAVLDTASTINIMAQLVAKQHKLKTDQKEF
jgi:hypothetical protein